MKNSDVINHCLPASGAHNRKLATLSSQRRKARAAPVYSTNGHGAGPPGNEKGRRQPAHLPQADSAYNGNGHSQAQSRNGNSEPATGSIIGEVGKPYERMPRDIFDDDRLSPAAIGVLTYLLSRPPNWLISVKQLKKRFHGHPIMVGNALAELQQIGYAARVLLLYTPDGKRGGQGQMWFVRRSLEDEWPKRFVGRGLEVLTCRFLDVRKHGRLTNTDTKSKLNRDISVRVKGKAKRKAAKQANAASKPKASFVSETYQNQDKPEKAHIARMLQGNWGERPAQSHTKWPEFWKWCRSQRGRPSEQGFWTWLAGQHRYWRDKIKPCDEIQGYVLDGKFYTPEQAQEIGKLNPDQLVRFQPAIKRSDTVTRRGHGRNGQSSNGATEP